MEDEKRERIKYFGFAGMVGVLLLLNLAGVWKTVLGVDTAAILTVLAGYRIFYNSISALLEKQISADLAICIAVIAALSVGEYLAAAEAMFIMLLGEGLEAYAAGRTNAAIARFVEQMPRRARVLRDGREVEVDASDLILDDIVIVRAGERITADGIIQQGASSIDESTITGESLPRDKQSGDEVFSGTVNGGGLLHVRVSRAGADTTLSRVVALVEEAREKRAPVERLADRYAKYFLPALLLAGAVTFYYTRDWSRTVAVLLVACPCALILATPTAMVAAIGGLARRGILVRGGTVLQEAARIDTLIYDKTGTVTEGRFEVIKLLPSGHSEDDLLRLAAQAESASDHVLAKAIVDYARMKGVVPLPATNARVIAGRGVESEYDGKMVRAGNASFLSGFGIGETEALVSEADRLGATAVLVAEGETLAGALLLRDRIRAGAKEAVAEFREHGVSHQLMLTGDRKRAAEVIARELGIPALEADLLPEQKLDRVRALASQGRRVGMVGDGMNDAPALAVANVGIAVSGASDITAEAADVVYMGHSLDKLPKLLSVSRAAVSTAWQNIFIFAGVVNLAAVAAAAYGIIGPLGAAFTHQISSFLVMLNSLRLLRVERPAGHVSRISKIRERMLSPLGRWAARIDFRASFAWIVEHRERLTRPALAAGVALIALNGFYIVSPEELGVLQRFGRNLPPLREPGLHYKLPWPIETLARVPARRVRVAEIGFRSGEARAGGEPAAYEWNVQHRSGRFQRKPEESLILTGDQNMVEINATVHYRIARPDDFLFRQLDGDATVRVAAESMLQMVTSSASLDAALTTGRKQLEAVLRRGLQARLDRYRAGVEVLAVKLLDVHPSLDVVDAFRAVSGAFEEKNRLINEAEGYRNEQVALARGRGTASLETAKGYSAGRINRSDGDAARFRQAEEAARASAAITELRLYLETMEQVLPGKKKMIVDAGKGRRNLLLVENGVEISRAAGALLAPVRPPTPKEDIE